MGANPDMALTDGELVDFLGRVRQEIAAAQQRERTYKAVVAERGLVEAEGRVFKLTTVTAVKTILDTDKIKEMPEKWLAAHSKTQTTVSLRTSLRAEAVAQLMEAA